MEFASKRKLATLVPDLSGNAELLQRIEQHVDANQRRIYETSRQIVSRELLAFEEQIAPYPPNKLRVICEIETIAGLAVYDALMNPNTSESTLNNRILEISHGGGTGGGD